MCADRSWEPSRWRRDPSVDESGIHSRVAQPSASAGVTPLSLRAAPDHHGWMQPHSPPESQTKPLESNGTPLTANASYSAPRSYHHASSSHYFIDSRGQSQPPSHHSSATWPRVPCKSERSSTVEQWRNDDPLTIHISRTLPRDHVRLDNQDNNCQPLPRHRIADRGTTSTDAPLLALGPACLQLDGRDQSPRQHALTSLPPFALISGEAGRSEAAGGIESTSETTPSHCRGCAKLRSMLSEVAIAVGKLDANVQMHCHQSVKSPVIAPHDDPPQAVEWILERLLRSERDLSELSQRQPTDMSPQPGPAESQASGASRPSKRQTERWEEERVLKRSRTDDSTAMPHHTPPGSARDDHWASINFSTASREATHPAALTPPPTESVPGSAHPGPASPSSFSRYARILPSPSSMVPSSSFAPSSARHGGSPRAIDQFTSWNHATSSPSVADALIADLQHQVSVKTLQLRALRDEYEALLQKLQRERVKSVAIEKRSAVADQELNELLAKNEDLAEQMKVLQSRLEDSEQKYEGVHANVKMEKSQWSRMLEMSNRLQEKHSEERQKLADDNAVLKKRISGLEGLISKRSAHDVLESPTGRHRALVSDRSARFGPTSEVDILQQDNERLQMRVEALRQALEETSTYHADVLCRMQEQSSKLRSNLDDDNPDVRISGQASNDESRASPPIMTFTPESEATPRLDEASMIAQTSSHADHDTNDTVDDHSLSHIDTPSVPTRPASAAHLADHNAPPAGPAPKLSDSPSLHRSDSLHADDIPQHGWQATEMPPPPRPA